MSKRSSNESDINQQKANGRRARVLPKPKRLPFHPQRVTRAKRLQLPI